MKQKIIGKILGEMMLNIAESEVIEEHQLDKFKRMISWARERGYNVHGYEDVYRCYKNLVDFDYRSYGVSCEDYYGGDGAW